MLGLVALVSLAAYLITPESAAGPANDPAGFAFNLRYAAPAACAVAGDPAARPPSSKARAARRPLIAVLRSALLATIIPAFAVARAPRPRRHPARGGAAARRRGAGRDAVAAALAGAAAVGRGAPADRPAPPPATAGSGITARALPVQPGRVVPGAVVGVLSVVRDARVGVVGTFGGFFAYPLWGPDGSNHVQYIGARGPHGRSPRSGSCPQWRRAINAGRTRLRRHRPRRATPGDPKQPAAARPRTAGPVSDPTPRLVLSRRAPGQPIDVYRISGRLDPEGCPRRSQRTS